MIQPKDEEVTGQDGAKKTFVLSKFPAIAGREIIAGYPLTAIPKLNEYKANEDIMLKLMAYVGVYVEGRAEPLMLQTRALIDNHVTDWEMLAKLEIAMMQYNCSFFGKGSLSTFCESLGQMALRWITGTLIPSLAQSLQKAAPRSKS